MPVPTRCSRLWDAGAGQATVMMSDRSREIRIPDSNDYVAWNRKWESDQVVAWGGHTPANSTRKGSQFESGTN